MNFYQKMYGLVTLLFTGMTAMIIFVFFQSPYSRNFQIETTAIIFAELLVGLCIIYNVRKNDSILIHVAGYTVTAIVYLLFTLGMIYVACGDLLPIRFLAIHIFCFTITVILMLFFVISEHHMNDQERNENAVRVQMRELIGTMREIAVVSDSAFAGDKELLKKIHCMADEVRFLPDPSSEYEFLNWEIDAAAKALKQAAENKDQAAFSETLDRLSVLFRNQRNSI